MTTHNLKTHPIHFQEVWDERKNFEVRLNDRGFQVGDILHLQEWDPSGVAPEDPLDYDTRYTGRTAVRVITYILPWNAAFSALAVDFCILSIKPPTSPSWDVLRDFFRERATSEDWERVNSGRDPVLHVPEEITRLREDLSERQSKLSDAQQDRITQERAGRASSEVNVKRPPTVPEALWRTFSAQEKAGVAATFENRHLVMEMVGLLKKLPQENLLYAYACTVCALNGYDREVCIESAYRSLNIFDSASKTPPTGEA